jgi:hypothetical protein
MKNGTNTAENMKLSELVRHARSFIGTSYGDQYQFCQEHNIPRSTVSMFLTGQREPTAKILEALGYRKVVTYERIENPIHAANEGRNRRAVAHNAP